MKRRMIKVVAALASACMVASSFAGAAFAAEGDGSTPRNETLYFAGQQWGAINDWNPMSEIPTTQWEFSRRMRHVL